MQKTDGVLTPDPRFGRSENNCYIDLAPGFVNYAGGNLQLAKEAADSLGIEWIDMS